MSRRIDFINPFGTSAYDGLIAETLTTYAAQGTELTISHLRGCPPDIDYYYNKHLVETALFELLRAAGTPEFKEIQGLIK